MGGYRPPPCPGGCPPAAAYQPPPCPRTCPPAAAYQPPPCPGGCPAGYAWGSGQAGPAESGGYSYERTESRSDSGWTYSEQNGQGSYQSWNDAPPPVREYRQGYWGGGQGGPPPGYADGAGQWQDGSYGAVYPVSGRDAYGYLVWPGKTPQ